MHADPVPHQCPTVDATLQHGRQTAQTTTQTLILLVGPMGAGKTHWTKGFVAGRGITDPVSSPTYTLLNIYGPQPRAVHHFDLYRIGSLEELFDLGFFEMVESGCACVVEWPERVPELFSLPHLRVTFRVAADADADADVPREITTQDVAGKGPIT